MRRAGTGGEGKERESDNGRERDGLSEREKERSPEWRVASSRAPESRGAATSALSTTRRSSGTPPRDRRTSQSTSPRHIPTASRGSSHPGDPGPGTRTTGPRNTCLRLFARPPATFLAPRARRDAPCHSRNLNVLFVAPIERYVQYRSGSVWSRSNRVGPSRSDLAECSLSTFLPEDRPNATRYADTLGESRRFGATTERRELRASNARSRHPI